jgi:hypothetical protein
MAMETARPPLWTKIYVNPKGIKYVYFDYPYWDTDKGYGKHRRLYIGKLGENGEFLPNAYYEALVGQGTTGKPSSYQPKKERDELIFQYKLKSDKNINGEK